MCNLELSIRQVNLPNASLALVKRRLDCALAAAPDMNDEELPSARGGPVILVDLTPVHLPPVQLQGRQLTRSAVCLTRFVV